MKRMKMREKEDVLSDFMNSIKQCKENQKRDEEKENQEKVKRREKKLLGPL